MTRQQFDVLPERRRRFVLLVDPDRDESPNAAVVQPVSPSEGHCDRTQHMCHLTSLLKLRVEVSESADSSTMDRAD